MFVVAHIVETAPSPLVSVQNWGLCCSFLCLDPCSHLCSFSTHSGATAALVLLFPVTIPHVAPHSLALLVQDLCFPPPGLLLCPGGGGGGGGTTKTLFLVDDTTQETSAVSYVPL